MKVHIIVDSTVDLLPEIKARTTVVPLTVHFGEEEYIDGITITHQQFYEKLVETDVLPRTSQANPDAFASVFAEITAAGDSAVVITVSSSFSGTYQSAIIAAVDYDNIHVVDSRTVAIGAGILAKMALEMADLGFDAPTIAKTLDEEKKKIRIVALVDTLEYLKKGGRISKTVAFAGSLLNIKPVLSVVDGEIALLGKARGSKQGNNLLVTEIEKCGGVDFTKPVLLGYTGLSDALLQKYIADSAHIWEQSVRALETTVIGSVIGTHVGPGAVAVAFFAK
ncbi:MAG: DegV family protein [Ruminococcaceae bacterium]|nr:DegV family protein [Oscillospiraceae bacterium]